MKTWIKVLTVLAMALSLIACGKKEVEKKEIVVWETMDVNDRKAFVNIVDEFMKENPSIKISVTHYEGEQLRVNFQNATLAGQGPDIIYAPNDTIGIFTVSDLIKPVDEIVSKEFLNSIDPAALESGAISGVYYQIPAIRGNQIALLYNKNMVKEAPKNWDEFLKVASKFQKVDKNNPENSTYGLLYLEKEPYWFIGWYNGFGGKVMNDKYEPTLNNDAMVKALQFVYDIRNKYNLGEAGMDYDMSAEMFKQGKTAFTLNGPWSWNDYVKAGIDLGITPMVMPEGRNAVFYSATKGYSISNELPEDKYEDVNKFFEFIFMPENNAKFALAQSQIPTVIAARDLEEIKGNALIQSSIATVKDTTHMPIVAEMRAIWDGMRPNLEAVINGQMTPKEAAAKMQQDAEAGIKAIRGE
jgi:maltose-binding protein MalE